MSYEFNIKNGFISNNNSIVQGTLTATTIVATTYLNLPYSGSASGTTNYLSKFTGTNSIGNSILYDNGTVVGIGTTSPTSRLQVTWGDVTIPSLGSDGGQFKITTSDTRGLVSGNITGGDFYMQVQRIDSTATAYNLLLQPNGGNIGVGKTNPNVKLDVIGDIRASSFFYGTTAQVNNIQTNGQNLSIKGVGSTLVTIDQTSGNVGIGTTSPTSKLDILDTTLAGSGDLSGSALNIAQTWNTTGTPTAIKLNVTNTASTGSTKLLDLQVGSVTKSSIDANGTGVFFGLSVSTGGIYTTNIYDSGSATNSKITMGGSSKYIAFNTNNTEAARISSNQNLLLGTTSDNGSKLNVQGSVTASSAIARGQYLSPTLVAAANDDVLVGLDIASTFTLGAFTNVGQYHLRIASPPTNGYSIFLGGNATINGSNQMNLSRNGAAVFGSNSLETNVSTAGPNVPLKFTLSSGALEFGRFAATTGNLLLGTTSDGGAKLQVSGSINPTSTVARGVSISPTLVATANNDTLIGLDINANYAGGVGTTNTIVGGTGYSAGTYTNIALTGGTGTGAIATIIVVASAVTTVTITTPGSGYYLGNTLSCANTIIGGGTGSGFVLTVNTLSNTGVKPIGLRVDGINIGRGGGYAVSNTAIGVTSMQFTTTGVNNTSIGWNAGYANTSGQNNLFIGSTAGYSNTSGQANTYIGNNAGYFNNANFNFFLGINAGFGNIGGGSNSYIGSYAGMGNVNGSSNLFNGFQAGRYITDGTTQATSVVQSVFIGVNTKALANSQTNQIVIGYDSTGLGSNTTVLGNSSTVTSAIYGNLLLGTTTDNNSKLNVQGSITAASAIARGSYIAPTLVAAANNDTLIGLDINPTFSGGSFTGVTNYAMRVYGGIRISNGTQIGIIGQPSSYNIYVSSTETAINSTSILSFQVNGSTYGRMFNTGNLVLQNGGTFTDIPSARLQINSTTQGVLLPRMTTSQINGIVSPVQGLTVFNTDLNTLCFYTTSWQKVTNTAM